MDIKKVEHGVDLIKKGLDVLLEGLKENQRVGKSTPKKMDMTPEEKEYNDLLKKLSLIFTKI